MKLHSAEIPEWEAEDIVSGFLGTPAVLAGQAQAEEMLNAITLKLPDLPFSQRLPSVAAAPNPIGDALAADTKNFDFYVVQVTPSILVPDGNRLNRLRVRLELASDKGVPAAWDLFPPDKWDVKRISLAEAKIDVSKALLLVCPAAADCLGLKLDIPIGWNTQTVSIRTSDRMSNPVEWYVTDDSVQHGFSATVIVRVPKQGKITVAASMAGEIRKANLLGRILKARFITDTKEYAVSA